MGLNGREGRRTETAGLLNQSRDHREEKDDDSRRKNGSSFKDGRGQARGSLRWMLAHGPGSKQNRFRRTVTLVQK